VGEEIFEGEGEERKPAFLPFGFLFGDPKHVMLSLKSYIIKIFR